MKKPLFLLMIAVLLMIAGCAANTPTVRRTYEQTPLDEIESRTSNHEEHQQNPNEELGHGNGLSLPGGTARTSPPGSLRFNLCTVEPKRRYFL